MWKPLTDDEIPSADVLAKAETYKEAGRVIAGGRWHVLPDGQVVHETQDGNWQVSLHDRAAFDDPTRFTPA